MTTVYLSLGSNVGDREQNLRAAIDGLASCDLNVLRLSPVYETEPLLYADQPWFLNLVVEAETVLPPMELLARIAEIERALGRTRSIPNGPRTIDIDILLYGTAVIRTADLEIPHPRMSERLFVLAPLADLTPDLRHPVTDKCIREMLTAAPAEAMREWRREA